MRVASETLCTRQPLACPPRIKARRLTHAGWTGARSCGLPMAVRDAAAAALRQAPRAPGVRLQHTRTVCDLCSRSEASWSSCSARGRLEAAPSLKLPRRFLGLLVPPSSPESAHARACSASMHALHAAQPWGSCARQDVRWCNLGCTAVTGTGGAVAGVAASAAAQQAAVIKMQARSGLACRLHMQAHGCAAPRLRSHMPARAPVSDSLARLALRPPLLLLPGAVPAAPAGPAMWASAAQPASCATSSATLASLAEPSCCAAAAALSRAVGAALSFAALPGLAGWPPVGCTGCPSTGSRVPAEPMIPFCVLPGFLCTAGCSGCWACISGCPPDAATSGCCCCCWPRPAAAGLGGCVCSLGS